MRRWLLLGALLLAAWTTATRTAIQSALTPAALIQKVEAEALPIFEVGAELQQLADAEHSEVELVNIFHAYLQRIQDHYLAQFEKTSSSHFHAAVRAKSALLRECRAAMMAAVPKSRLGRWSIEIYLSDLEARLDEFLIGKANELVEKEEQGEEEEAAALVPRWLSPAARRRCKWLLSQGLLLMANFAQHEWHRRQGVRAVERRLAEVPEFPLL